MKLNVKYAELPKGIRLPYVEQGDASGVPVIFLHGYTDSWRSFELLLPELPERIHAFALTQRGHGDASRPETGYSQKDFAADAAAFIDAVGLQSAVIVGHSMGGLNAQRFAIDYPERTLGLVLISTATNCRDNRDVAEFYENGILQLSDPVPGEFAREFQESTLAKPIPESQLEIFVQESLKLPARIWKAVSDEFMVADFSDELSKIKAPTLVLYGVKDVFFPLSDQETLAEKIENSEMLIYPENGHSPHWENPEKVSSALVNFIENKIEKKRAQTFQAVTEPAQIW